MSRLLAIVAIALCSASCSYFEFTMKEYTGWPIVTRILYDRHNVSRIAQNAVQLSSEAKIAMRCEQITDGIFSTEIKLQPGSTLRLQTRTTPYDDSIATKRGIVIDITDGETSVTVDGRTRKINTPLPNKAPFVVELYNDGQWTHIFVACVDVGRYESSTPSTQWIIASLPSGGTALIADPSIEPLYSTN
ncbi:MAG: hypothetical protein H7X70_04375 [Candidatus Kapabacteria bacterium]|nr:hypothetical protein [Candidatus Kapabacteria bacterium]